MPATLKDAAQTWHSFLSSFGLPAYDESTVPEDAELPRITYSYVASELGRPVSLTASLWYRTKSWEAITLKAEEIYEYITRGGVALPIVGGYLWVKRGSPFSQRVSDPDDGIRRIVLNFEVEFLR